MLVFDNVLADPIAFRAAALMAPVPVEDVLAWCAPGVLATVDPELDAAIRARVPAALPASAWVVRGAGSPSAIRTGMAWPGWQAVLFLDEDPPAGEGIVFWRHVSTGRFQGLGNLGELQVLGDESQWAPWLSVAAKFNRLVLFAADHVWSRAVLPGAELDSDLGLRVCVRGLGELGPLAAGAAFTIVAPEPGAIH